MTPKSRLWKVRVLDADNRLRHVVFVHAPSRAFARSNAVEKIERLGISRARGWNSYPSKSTTGRNLCFPQAGGDGMSEDFKTSVEVLKFPPTPARMPRPAPQTPATAR